MTISLSLLVAALYFSVPTAEKAAERDLTFLVTFDRHNARADFAKGSPDAFSIRDLDLGLRGFVGFDGQSAFKPEPGESLRFPAKRNFDPHRGTLIVWVVADGYDPCEAKTDGKDRGNVAYAHLVAHGTDGREIAYHLYECENEVFVDWTATPNPWSWGQIGRVHFERKGIRPGEWHQLAFTWDDEWLTLYLNGEQMDRAKMPEKVRETSALQPDDSTDSFVGVRSAFLGDKLEWGAGVDDYAVFSRPLSPIEIRNRYLRQLKDKGGRVIHDYDVTLNGVVTSADDKIDRLEAEFDFAALPEKVRADWQKGRLAMDWTLVAPDGVRRTGAWTFAAGEKTKVLDGVVAPGAWTLETKLADKAPIAVKIVKPEMPWLGNGLGDEDEVPAIWRDFAVDGRNVVVWNRRYAFGAGPLPEKVFAYGREILSRRPRLLIDGREPKWSAGSTERTNRDVTFTGTGSLGRAKLAYRTKVHFDGMIEFDWTVDGQPAVGAMTLDWQVKPENAQYLMTPTLCQEKGDPQTFPFPKSSGKPKMLWLVAEKRGGFAFMAVNDANWIHDPEKPVYFADRRTGDCRVTMITKPVAAMPAATPYKALFVATPTRPQPERIRAIRYAEWSDKGKKVTHGGGEGMFASVFTHLPASDGSFERMYAKMADESVVPYGGMKSLTDAEPETAYLGKYWNRPGAYTYTMPLWSEKEPGKREKKLCFSRSACASTVYSDYYVWCDWKLWTHPLGRKFWQSYSDLCGVGICSNPHHGCRYRDKFGREVSSFDVLHTRKLIQRLVAVAHRYGKTILVHGQRDFVPFAQGLADYWLPGEQFTGVTRRNAYAYTDEVQDEIWRSEFNRDVIGVGIIQDVALGQSVRPYTTPESWKYTWAMLAALAPHDIETSAWWCAPKPMAKFFDVLETYGVDRPDAVCHRFYEQTEVKSSDPAVRTTWYACPGGGILLVLANRDADAHKTEIDVSALRLRDVAAYDEIFEKGIAVKDGRFTYELPSRSFALIGLPPRTPKGALRDGKVLPEGAKASASGGSLSTFDIWDRNDWGCWKGEKSTAVFAHCADVGHAAPGALVLRKGRGCFLKRFAAVPGREYTATVWVKAKDIAQTTSVKLEFQGQDEKTRFLGTESRATSAPAADCADWRRLVLTFSVPEKGRWKDCANILVTVGADAGPSGELLVDDFCWRP